MIYFNIRDLIALLLDRIRVCLLVIINMSVCPTTAKGLRTITVNILMIEKEEWNIHKRDNAHPSQGAYSSNRALSRAGNDNLDCRISLHDWHDCTMSDGNVSRQNTNPELSFFFKPTSLWVRFVLKLGVSSRWIEGKREHIPSLERFTGLWTRNLWIDMPIRTILLFQMRNIIWTIKAVRAIEKSKNTHRRLASSLQAF